MKKHETIILLSTEELEEELSRVKHKGRYRATVRSTIFTLITVAAVAVLVATLWLPVLEIYGTAMTPAIEDGDIVFSVKNSDFEEGDVIAFYYNNKILVKRVIASAGDWVNMDESGNVYVNNQLLDEPYLSEKALGEIDIDLPYQVPDEKVFVMGNHRATSIDSRSKTVGCVSQEQIIGKIFFRIWPLERAGTIH